MHCRWRSSYQEGRVGIPLACLTLPHFCACPKPGHGFLRLYVVVYFLCSVSSGKMRGDCLFCCY